MIERRIATCAAAFAILGVKQVRIRCDPGNACSAAIPRRLGFRHLETRRADSVRPDEVPRDTMV